MEVVVALVAAVIATGFAVDLTMDWRRQPRLHGAVWAAGMASYAAATWALFLGLALGWSDALFRLFYLLGAIVNIPLLAVGSVSLVLGPKAGKRSLVVVLVWIAAASIVTLLAPFAAPLEAVGVPEGSEVFAFVVAIGGVSLPGPRVFAAVSGAVGSIVIVGLAVYSAARFHRSDRKLAGGNVLIAAGIIAPAFGGSMTALGEGTGFALSLLIGATLLWSGYRIARDARRRPAAGPFGDDDAGKDEAAAE